jgi:hypothetical protein
MNAQPRKRVTMGTSVTPASTTPPRSIKDVVGEVVQALQAAQGQTLDPPATMSLLLVATPQILGQGHLPGRPLGAAGQALVNAWSAGPAAERRIELVRGNGQIAKVSTRLPVPPTVLVADGFGRPVANEKVDFTPSPSGGKVTPTTASTGKDGTAAVEWDLGTTTGVHTLDASVGSGPKITFTVIAV